MLMKTATCCFWRVTHCFLHLTRCNLITSHIIRDWNIKEQRVGLRNQRVARKKQCIGLKKKRIAFVTHWSIAFMTQMATHRGGDTSHHITGTTGHSWSPNSRYVWTACQQNYYILLAWLTVDDHAVIKQKPCSAHIVSLGRSQEM